MGHDPVLPSAIYFKNPSKEIIKQSKYSPRTSAGILFIQGSNNFRGKFTLAKTVNAGHIMSGGTIDLSMADFIHPVTKINVSTLLGSVKVIVPRGVRVRSSGLSILGGFRGIQTGQNVDAGEDAPLAILGGIDVSINENVPPVRIITLPQKRTVIKSM